MAWCVRVNRESRILPLARRLAFRYDSVPAATNRVKRNAATGDESASGSDIEGVDELHETPHNLISLLLTNTTLCRRVERPAAPLKSEEFFNNQQSISVGV